MKLINVLYSREVPLIVDCVLITGCAVASAFLLYVNDGA